MALLRIRHDGDPVLRKKSRKVEKPDPIILLMMDDMAETMYGVNGIGLAAPQVGVNKRFVVVDVGDGQGLFKMINPRVIATSETSCVDVEGCLSVPGLQGEVERPETITVKAMGPDGKYFKKEAEGLLARCIQHEIDHLDGILFTDKAISVWEPKAEEEEAGEDEEGGEEDSGKAPDARKVVIKAYQLAQEQQQAIFAAGG